MSLRTGSVVGGLGLTATGGFSLCLGLLRSPLLPASLGSVPGHAMASLVGFLLVISGILFAIFSFRPAIERAEVVPADVAFITRIPRPIDEDEVPRRRAAAPRPKPAVRAAEPTPTSQIDDEIRELTRRINKAGVMLATGQISHQGYASYVEELKKRRGNLEASRVRIELRHHE